MIPHRHRNLPRKGRARGLDQPVKHGRTDVIIAGATKMELILIVHSIRVMLKIITNVDVWNVLMDTSLAKALDAYPYGIPTSTIRRIWVLKHL